ncbi:MAG TPA: hypothetical protein VME92_17085 [Acetobacteraceae bacterium]|nr:hypothetical protein [Acetobacteraceae bacterium]
MHVTLSVETVVVDRAVMPPNGFGFADAADAVRFCRLANAAMVEADELGFDVGLFLWGREVMAAFAVRGTDGDGRSRLAVQPLARMLERGGAADLADRLLDGARAWSAAHELSLAVDAEVPA